MNRTLPTVFILFALLFTQGCTWLRQDMQDPQISLISFQRLPGDGLLEQRFSLRLRLSNPNDLRLDVKGLRFSFLVEGVELIRGVSSDVPVIEPYGEAEFTVTGSAHMLDAIRLFNELRRDPRARFAYTLHTDIDLTDKWLPTLHLKRDGEINLQTGQ